MRVHSAAVGVKGQEILWACLAVIMCKGLINSQNELFVFVQMRLDMSCYMYMYLVPFHNHRFRCVLVNLYRDFYAENIELLS